MKTALMFILIFAFSLDTLAQTQTGGQTKAPPRLARIRQRDLETPTESPKVLDKSLPIKRVILYSNGVAYIERRGVVNGHAEISLSFKQSQVDDVLKSMVVLLSLIHI